VDNPQLPEIDSLWNYDDPSGSEANFRRVVSTATLPESTDYRAQLITQIARCQALQRRFEEGHATLDEVDELLSERTPTARIRSLLERGRIWNDTGRTADAALVFEQALHLAETEGRDALAVDAAHMLGVMQPYDAAARWNQRAIAIAEASGEPRARRWIGTLYINLGWNYQRLERYADAERAFAAAVPALEQIDNQGRIRTARLCLAKNRRLLGDPDGALPLQQQLLAEVQAAGEPEGYALEEIAECLLAMGKIDESKSFFARAYASLSTYPWFPPNESERLERLRVRGGLE
jgi:tetratricopeptide (TPR) repeat protein